MQSVKREAGGEGGEEGGGGGEGEGQCPVMA